MPFWSAKLWCASETWRRRCGSWQHAGKPMRVKICGITNREDALLAVEAGAHALGFVFADSPRQVTPGQAAKIIAELPPFVQTVGVFVDEDVEPVLIRCPLDAVQFHGDEPPEEL